MSQYHFSFASLNCKFHSNSVVSDIMVSMFKLEVTHNNTYSDWPIKI